MRDPHALVRTAAVLAWCGATAGAAWAQGQQVTVLCSTDQGWCELAAKEFQARSGIKVLQVHKATGEALAQLRAEAANPKTDLWWGGTGDPYLQAAEVGLLDAYRPGPTWPTRSTRARSKPRTRGRAARAIPSSRAWCS